MASVTQATSVADDGTPIATPQGCTNFKLRQLTRRVAQQVEPFFAATGLKPTQYSLLAHIDHLGPIQPSLLARHMGLEASTLSRNLQPLIAGGWVEQGAGDNARSRQLRLSPAGQTKRAAMKADWKRAQQALNERLGAARVAQLHALIDDCLALLGPEAAAEE